MSSIKSYKDKRNFNQINEPEPSGASLSEDASIFVIQKYEARGLHYDFRLDLGGNLKSWVLPKGPSTDPSEKRLAIPVEDHLLEYAEIEGVIPEGQYGTSPVMIWDRRTYKNMKPNEEETTSLETAYAQGHLKFYLKGEKISGGFSLVKSESGQMEGNWLLVKIDDEADARRNPTSTQQESIVSERIPNKINNEKQLSE